YHADTPGTALTQRGCQQSPLVESTIQRTQGNPASFNTFETWQRHGMSLASFAVRRRRNMEPFLSCDSQAILVEDKSFQAAKCDQCGAKMCTPSRFFNSTSRVINAASVC